ncbi:Hypothetical protein NocV09_02300640 [Nannochloropsis oceanica]
MASSSKRMPTAHFVDQSFLHANLSCVPDPLPPISSTPGKLVAVWATVSDFVGVSIKERTWWHLRHLHQSIMPGSAKSDGQDGNADEETGENIGDGGMIRPADFVVGKWSSHAHRKATRGSIIAGTTSPSSSSSSQNFSSPVSPVLSQLTKALASSAGAPSVSRGGSPTVTTLDLETSPSTVTHSVNEDNLRTIILEPSTQVFFVYDVQRLVFCLQISRSLFRFQSGVIPAELMESTLVKALKSLITGETDRATHAVKLFITIVACDAEGGEGYPLCHQTLPALLGRVGPFLNEMENKMVANQQESRSSHRPCRDQSPRPSTFERLVQLSIFALQFLPANAAPSIVLIVDGVFHLGHAAVAEYDDLTMQLCRDDIVLSIVCLAPLQDPSTALGYIGDFQMLEKAVKTTGGCVLCAADVGQKLASCAEYATISVPLRYMLAHHTIGVQNLLQASLLVRYSRLNVPVEIAVKPYSSATVVSGAAPMAAAAIAAMPITPPAPAPPFITTRDKLMMYSLPLVCLRMLVEWRAAEGFHANAVHLGGMSRAAERPRINLARDSGSSTGKVKHQHWADKRGSSSRRSKIMGIEDTTVLVRFTRSLDSDLSVEYTLEYCPLPAAAGQGLGAANVTIEVVSSMDWICEANVLQQPLWRFLRTLQDNDFRLCRVLSQLKPQPKFSPPTQGARHSRQEHQEEEWAQYQELIHWLGQLSMRDWTRWLHATCFELLTLGKEVIELREGESFEAGLGSDVSGEKPTSDKYLQLGLRVRTEKEAKVDEDGRDSDFSNLHVQEELLLTLLGHWCTSRVDEDLFLKILVNNSKSSSMHPRRGTPFVLLKLLWVSDHLVRLHLGFFGVEGPIARQSVRELQNALIRVDGPLQMPEAPLAFQLLIPGREKCDVLPYYPAIQERDALLRSYLKKKRWSWHLGLYTDLPTIMDTLMRAQIAVGFTLIHKDRQQTLLVQHISLSITLGDEGKGSTLKYRQHICYQQQQQQQQHAGGRSEREIHTSASTAAMTRSALVQYRVLIEAPHGLSTEIWIEPQHGSGAARDHGVPIPEADLWQTLAANCYERDRRVLSAMDSFLYIRHLCTDAHPELAGTNDRSPRRPRCVPHDLNLLEVLRGSEKTELTLHLFSPLAPDPMPPPISMRDESGELTATTGDENNRQLHFLTERALRTLLGTEIPACCLNAAAEGEEDVVYKSRCQGQDLLWKVELGLTGWREGKCYAHQVSDDALSIWFLAPYQARQAAPRGINIGGRIAGKVERPQMVIKIFTITFQQLLARLIGTTGSNSCGHQSSTWSYSGAAGNPRALSQLPSDNPLLAYILYLHRRNFTQVAYMALRCARPIAPTDLRDALGYCSEIGMDLDMTHLRKIALGSIEARHRLEDQAMVGMVVSRSNSDGYNNGIETDTDHGQGLDEEEETQENETVGSSEIAKPLGKEADKAFQQAISSWLAPVPGTDFYYYVGSEEDLYGDENDMWEATRQGLSAEDSAVISSMVPPKIYMRKASNPGTSLGQSAAISSKRNDGGLRGNDAVDRSSPATSKGGIAGLFQQGYEAELGMMLKMLEVKRKAQARNLKGSRSHGTAAMEEDVSFVTPCFVRFEVVHAMYGLAQSRVFRITSTTPPSKVLPFCFDDAVAREDMWVAPRVSRQATSVSIICATHSRLDVAKFEAALEGACRQKTNGEDGSSTDGLSLSEAEAKDLMLTTHKRFLRLVRRRVEAWAAAETLQCLQSFSPLPTMAAPTIHQCLRPLSAEAITRLHVTLAFVANLSYETREEEDSDDGAASTGPSYMGSTVPSRSGIPRRGTRRTFYQSDGGMERSGALNCGGEGFAMANLSQTEQDEEQALELFHEHLASCRFLTVRKAAGMYFVVEPSLPEDPLFFQTVRTSSSTLMSPPDRPSSLLSTPSPKNVIPPLPLDITLRATCAYRIPYWAILQVRRRKTRREASLSAAKMATSKEFIKKRRASSGGGDGRGKVQREVEPLGDYMDSYEVVVSVHHAPSAPWYQARHEVLENIRAKILVVCTHVNQILLLRHLHDTRHASPLLIAPTKNDLRYQEEMSNDGMSGSLPRGGSGGLGRAGTINRNIGPLPYPLPSDQNQHYQDPRKAHQVAGEDSGCGTDRGQAAVPSDHSPSLLLFQPDQFKCTRQLTLRFPVFHRLTPVAALRALESDVLHPLTVQNRMHTFVHRDRNGRVSYLNFETSKRKDSITPLDKEKEVHASRSCRDAPFGLDLDSSGHPAPVGGLSVPFIMPTSTLDPTHPYTITTMASTSGASAAWIDCHVHGVDEVGEELSIHLHRLLETRLAEISIFHLSELLSRNPRLQLTTQDLDLIKTGTAIIPPSAAVAAMGTSELFPPSSMPASATTAAGTTGGNRYQALLELPGGLLRFGDPYLFLLYLRQNTARAQFINNIHVSHGAFGHDSSNMMMGASTTSSLTSSGILRPGRAPSPYLPGNTYIASPSDPGMFGSGRGMKVISEVWVPEGANACTWHPSRIGFTGPRPLEPLSAATSHPAFWSLAGGMEVEIAPGLLDVYYNHNRPEVYVAGRKDVTTTLSSRGARLAKEVGKGLALVNVHPVDAEGNTLRRLRSAVSVTQEEINAIVVAAATTAASEEGRRTNKPLPWAVSILKHSPNIATVPECQEEPPYLARFSSLSSLEPSSVAYNWFRCPPEQQQQSSTPSKAFLYPQENSGKCRTTGGGGLWGISVEILGSVNGEPLLHWLKLCVDQALHDYFIERLLAYMKSPHFPLSGHAVPLEATERIYKALQPWEQLVESCLLLDSPSIRRQEGRQIIPLSEVGPLVHVVCRGMGQAHPFLQSTLTLLSKALTTTTHRQETRLHLVDPQALPMANLENEYILLGGLRVGDLALPSSPVSFSSRAAINTSKSTENLPQADSLYPALTASEGATASMGALRMTNRDTACVVRVTANFQSLVLYNCHPELAGRCVAAFERALALMSLERFVSEGIGLQKLGLLPLNVPWWRQIPYLPVLFEDLGRGGSAASPSGVEAIKGKKHQQDERGRGLLDIRSDKTRRTSCSPREEESNSNRGSSSGSSCIDGTDVALSTSFHTRKLRSEVSTTFFSADSVQQSISHDIRKASRPSIGVGPGAGPVIRPELAARGLSLPPGIVVTAAMAARMRASRRGNPPSTLRKPTSGTASFPATSVESAAGRGITDLSASSFPISSFTTSSGADTLVKRATSLSAFPTSDRLILGKGPSSESFCSLSGGAIATQENWLTGPQQWMLGLLCKATPATLQGSAQLSKSLRLVLPAVWALQPFQSDQTAAEVGNNSSNSNDPTLLHLRRLLDSILPYFDELEADDRLQELCHTWTWYQHLVLLQQRSSYLHSRVHGSPEVDMKILRWVRGECKDGEKCISQPQGSESPIKTAISLQNLELLLRRARWQGSWCAVLTEHSYLPRSHFRNDTLRLGLEVFKGLDSPSLSLSHLPGMPSSSSRPLSRTGTISHAVENKNSTNTSDTTSTSAWGRPLVPCSLSSSLSSMTNSSPSYLEHSPSAAPFLESEPLSGANLASRKLGKGGAVREEVKIDSKDEAKETVQCANITDDGGQRFFSRSSTISGPPSRIMVGQPSWSSTFSDDQGLGPTLSTRFSSRQIGILAGNDRKKQSIGNKNMTKEVKESKEAAATLSHKATMLRKREMGDFALAKGFLDSYTSYLQNILKMTLVHTASPAVKPQSSPSSEQVDIPAWLSLKRYLHRFVALTNTVIFAEVQCEHHRPQSNRYGASKVQIKLSLYTLDVQSPNGSTSTSSSRQHHQSSYPPSNVGTVSAMMRMAMGNSLPLPTTHTFVWNGGVGSLERVGESPGYYQQHAHVHLQLPQDVALSISQLELEKQVYDHLVIHTMQSLLKMRKRKVKRKEQEEVQFCEDSLALLKSLLVRNPEPPSHSQTVISVRYVCQPVIHKPAREQEGISVVTQHSANLSTANMLHIPGPIALLLHMKRHHCRYHLWPLQDETESKGRHTLVGAVSLKTWRLMDLKDHTDRESEDMVLFVLTVAEESAPAEYLVYVMHRKGKGRGQRGSFVEIPGHAKSLISHVLEAASFEFEKERIWDRVEQSLMRGGKERDDATRVGAVLVMGMPAATSTPIVTFPVLSSPTPGDWGWGMRSGPPRDSFFTSHHLNTLLRFSAACQPLSQVDPRLSSLFASSTATDDLHVPWLDVLSSLETDTFWRLRAVRVQGLREEIGEKDLLLCCDDDSRNEAMEEKTDMISKQGLHNLPYNAQSFLHFSVRRRGQEVLLEGKQQREHAQEIVVQIIHRDNMHQALTPEQRHHVSACIRHILGWIWLYVLAPEGRGRPPRAGT